MRDDGGGVSGGGVRCAAGGRSGVGPAAIFIPCARCVLCRVYYLLFQSASLLHFRTHTEFSATLHEPAKIWRCRHTIPLGSSLSPSVSSSSSSTPSLLRRAARQNRPRRGPPRYQKSLGPPAQPKCQLWLARILLSRRAAASGQLASSPSASAPPAPIQASSRA